MKNNKWTRSITLWILTAMSMLLLLKCFTHNQTPNIYQFGAVSAVGINIILFFYHQKLSIIFNGVILVLAVFLVLQFTIGQTSNSFGINIADTKIGTPNMQLSMLGLFVIYLFINLQYLLDLYEDWKEGKIAKNEFY